MARSLRIEYPGAYYHVMARGNRREAIFHDDEDRLFFLNALAAEHRDKALQRAASSVGEVVWRSLQGLAR